MIWAGFKDDKVTEQTVKGMGSKKASIILARTQRIEPRP